MKKNYLFLIAFLAIANITNTFGQSLSESGKKVKNINYSTNAMVNKLLANDYTFTKSTGTYANLSGAISLTNNQLWDDPTGAVPLGFSFQLYNMTTDSIYFGAGAGALVSTLVSAGEADFMIAPFEADLIDRGAISGTAQSPISAKLEGAPGSRIFKLEWKNAGFWSERDSLNTLNNFVNVQLWLYEGSNIIEMHYGPSLAINASIIYDGETGPIVGLADKNITNVYLLGGNPSAPVMATNVVFLSGNPSDGTIYRFSKPGTGIASNLLNNSDVQVSPNPFNKAVTFSINNKQLNNAALKVTDVLGRNVKTISNIQSNQIVLERDNLVDGIYFYTLTENDNIIATGKLIAE